MKLELMDFLLERRKEPSDYIEIIRNKKMEPVSGLPKESGEYPVILQDKQGRLWLSARRFSVENGFEEDSKYIVVLWKKQNNAEQRKIKDIETAHIDNAEEEDLYVKVNNSQSIDIIPGQMGFFEML